MSKRFAMRIRSGLIIAMVALLGVPIMASDQDDYWDMSIEDLMDVEIESVSKKAESFVDVPASVYVITAEDIRRSAATQLVDILNMVPGAFYADITFNVVTSGIRSPAAAVSQSVTLIVDGIPMNSLTSGGVPYEFIDIPLDRIKRIEVIKGPGGVIYGAGANTGIISIYTYSADDAEGGKLTIEGGGQEYVSPYLSQSFHLGSNSHLLVYGGYRTTRGYDRASLFDSDYLAAPRDGLSDTLVENQFTSEDIDGRESATVGASFQTRLSPILESGSRFEYRTTGTRQYQSTLYSPDPTVVDRKSRQISIQHRLDWDFGNRHSLFLHTSLLHSDVREMRAGNYDLHSLSANFEAQDNISWGVHDLSFGGNLRVVGFDICEANDEDDDIGFTVRHTTEYMYAAFIQDRIEIARGFDLTAGVKAETWTLISEQPVYSPSVRLRFNPNDQVVIWSGYSRSITTPGFLQSRIEWKVSEIPYIPLQTDHLFLPNTDEAYVAAVPSQDVQPVKYSSWELGLRTQMSSRSSLDIGLFYSFVDGILGVDANFMSKPPQYSDLKDNRTILPIYYANVYNGDMYGGEIVARSMVADWLRVEASYSFLRVDRTGREIPGQPGSFYAPPGTMPDAPEHIFRFRPYVDLPDQGWYFSSMVYWRSKYGRGEGFDYVTQTTPNTNDGLVLDPPDSEFGLDLLVEKVLLDGSLRLSAWGKDLTVDERSQGHHRYYEVGYPHTIHRTFGGGVHYEF